ncbi:unnamed protein product [Peniophora sp. CBMAI 1063]|nr:unnamed protein product [Peniophora sp. CBMAI 1063]
MADAIGAMVHTPSAIIFDHILGSLSSNFTDPRTFILALRLASVSKAWRRAFLQTDLASLITISGFSYPFQTPALLASPQADTPLEVKIDIRKLLPYPGVARTVLAHAVSRLRLVYGRITTLTIVNHEADNHDFDVNAVLNNLFTLHFQSPPTFVLDFGDRLYRCATPIVVLLGSAFSISVRNAFIYYDTLRFSRSLSRLSITKISCPSQRISIFLLHKVLPALAETLEMLELDHAVDWRMVDIGVTAWNLPPVKLVALKSLYLGYQLVHEAIAVMCCIDIPNVDTLSIRDGARDLRSLQYVNNSTALLCLIARKKEDHEFCVRLSLENVVFDNVVVKENGERLASYFLNAVCAADVLNLLYDIDIGHNAIPFLKAMRVANIAVATKYLRIKGVDYECAMSELVHRFVRITGDTRDLDAAILEPCYVDVVHFNMSDPDVASDYIGHFVSSGLQSSLRVRGRAEAGPQWEPSSPHSREWHTPVADEHGMIDWRAYRFSPDAQMVLDEEIGEVFHVDKVVELLMKEDVP